MNHIDTNLNTSSARWAVTLTLRRIKMSNMTDPAFAEITFTPNTKSKEELDCPFFQNEATWVNFELPHRWLMLETFPQKIIFCFCGEKGVFKKIHPFNFGHPTSNDRAYYWTPLISVHLVHELKGDQNWRG